VVDNFSRKIQVLFFFNEECRTFDDRDGFRGCKEGSCPPMKNSIPRRQTGKEGEEKRGEKKRKRERKGGDGASHLELQTCLRYY